VIGLLDRFSGDIGLIQPADMLPIRTLILTLSLLTLAAAAAQAQQSFVTDDANVTPKGHFHFEFSNEFDLLQCGKFAASPRVGAQLGISVDW
jgi:hypothetical protein